MVCGGLGPGGLWGELESAELVSVPGGLAVALGFVPVPPSPLCAEHHPHAPGTMAQVGHRVDYLAGFCCPVGGLVAGKPRVLCHESEIYLCNGSEFVYIYDQEGKVLKVSGPCCQDRKWGDLGTPPGSSIPGCVNERGWDALGQWGAAA